MIPPAIAKGRQPDTRSANVVSGAVEAGVERRTARSA